MINKLLQKLDSGEIIIFKHKGYDKFLAIGGAGKDSDGDYRNSGWFYKVEDAKHYIGYYSGFTAEELKEKLPNWIYIESYPHAYGERPKVDDKVLILPNAKKECEKYSISWVGNMEKMIGEVYEIQNYYNSNYMINGICLPRTAFVLAWEEEKHNCKICKKESVRPFSCGELCWDCFERTEQLKKDLEYLDK